MEASREKAAFVNTVLLSNVFDTVVSSDLASTSLTGDVGQTSESFPIAGDRVAPNLGEVWDVVGQAAAQVIQLFGTAFQQTRGTAVVLEGLQFDSDRL